MCQGYHEITYFWQWRNLMLLVNKRNIFPLEVAIYFYMFAIMNNYQKQIKFKILDVSIYYGVNMLHILKLLFCLKDVYRIKCEGNHLEGHHCVNLNHNFYRHDDLLCIYYTCCACM